MIDLSSQLIARTRLFAFYLILIISASYLFLPHLTELQV